MTTGSELLSSVLGYKVCKAQYNLDVGSCLSKYVGRLLRAGP